MSQIRSNNLYISSQLHRWLKWISELEQPMESSKPAMATIDSKAEHILRDYIIGMYPEIEQLEADYWTARNKLDSETVNKLKEHTATTDKPM